LEPTIFRFAWKYSARQQLFILAVTLCSLPFYYFSLDLPKQIINEAIDGTDFPQTVFDMEFGQVEYLMLLSFIFLGLVLINGAFKFYINVYKGRLGERMLRRLRYELYSRVLRFPLGHFRKVSQGEIIPMMTQEVEPVGGFVGEAFATPALQGGILLTALVFMFVQDPVLGLAAIALYPIQAYAIPKLQAKVNALAKQRVRRVRKLSEKIGESVSGVQDVRANDTSRLFRARFTADMQGIYDIRYEIYRRKFFIKFLNNFIAQLTPFFFYAIGGYYVIQGELSFGALVAVLAAYKDLAPPWKELLNYYQLQADVRIKYEQVVEQFHPDGILDPEKQEEEREDIDLKGEISLSNVRVEDDDGLPLIDGINCRIEPGTHLAVLGPSGGGKDVLTKLLARLELPSGGSYTIGGQNMAALPESVTGRRLGYVGNPAFIFQGTLKDNLLMGVMHRPVAKRSLDEENEKERARHSMEAAESGNLADSLLDEWTDRAELGLGEDQPATAAMLKMIEFVDLQKDIYNLGLRGRLDPETHPDIAARILDVRHALARKAEAEELTHLIEFFDIDTFNNNATVAENVLFGTPRDGSFDLDNLADHPFVRGLLDREGLTDEFIKAGRDVAETMVELFSDLPPDHEFFSQYSFISSEDLPEFQSLLARYDRADRKGLSDADRNRLLSLPFRLIPARHRLGIIDDDMKQKILSARARFREDLPEELKESVAFFQSDAYNAAATLQDNILFGKIAYGRPKAERKIGKAVAQILEEKDLTHVMLEIGLEATAGVSGGRLTAAQRQKLGLARVMLRNPDILVLNEAAAAIDFDAVEPLIERIRERFREKTLIWTLSRAEYARRFDRALVVENGRIVEAGPIADLDRQGSRFRYFVGTGGEPEAPQEPEPAAPGPEESHRDKQEE